MAKRKKKKADHLPKRIAGVKVPKSVRRGRLGQLLASPAGQAILADVAVGAGALAAARLGRTPKVRSFSHDASQQVAHAGRDTAHDMAEAGSTLNYAIGEAARSFADALHRGPPDQRRAGDGDASMEPAPSETRRGKQSSAREATP